MVIYRSAVANRLLAIVQVLLSRSTRNQKEEEL